MSDSNSLDLSLNRGDESINISEYVPNEIVHLELSNVFGPERWMVDQEDRQQASIHTPVANSGIGSKSHNQRISEEDKHENFTRGAIKPVWNKGPASNIVKILIPPDSTPNQESCTVKIPHKTKILENSDTNNKEIKMESFNEKPETQEENTCRQCGKFYKKKHNLKSHMRIHVFFKRILIFYIDWG